MTLIKLSSLFSPKSRYVQIACQGFLRTNNFTIQENEIVIDPFEFILAIKKLRDEEYKNLKDNNA